MEEITIYLNTIVDNFRHGQDGASQALLDAFEPIRGKYYRLLTTGIYDNKDRDIAHFLSMLGNKNLHNTARSLANAVKVSLGNEDLSQELMLCLFETALRYSNISSTYKYVVKEHMKSLLKETIYYENSDPDDMEKVGTWDHEEIDDKWVEGESASELWQSLSVRQRELMKTIYLDGYSIAECAERLDIPLTIVKREEKEARQIIATNLGRLDLVSSSNKRR
jgi:DNA-directed RNA polymerase specialized sigma24 family protein